MSAAKGKPLVMMAEGSEPATESRSEFRDDLVKATENLETKDNETDRTAEIAANAPRYRRKSSTFIDGIHDVSDDMDRAPAQLYSTMSGRLFHSGRIAIVMVGLPARGKTYVFAPSHTFIRGMR